MRKLVTLFLLTFSLFAMAQNVMGTQSQPRVVPDSDMIVRIAEIEVHEQYLDEYLKAAGKVGGASVLNEPDVVCIFPMQIKEAPNQVRIVEIYRNKAAYESHLATPHFQEYKQGTLHMVKSLKLVEVDPLDPQAMSNIFIKK